MFSSYSPFSYSLFTKHDTSASSSTGSNDNVLALDVLANFFIACPSLARKEEEEHKRILFYSPLEETPTRKAEVTGMADAMVNFTSELMRIGNNGAPYDAPRRPHRFVRSTKWICVFLPVESDFIIGATLSREKCSAKGYYAHSRTLLKMVENAYEMYKFFYGSFRASFGVDDKSASELVYRLDTFFSNYLTSLSLSKIPLLDALDGISYMPLEARLFLEAQCFVEKCAEACPNLRIVALFYQTRLAQYSLDRRALRTLSRFLTEHLIPQAAMDELHPEVVTQNTSTGRFVGAKFDFILQDGNHPLVYVEDEETGEPREYYLIAYRSLNATLCMLVPTDVELVPTLARLRPLLEPKMSEIASAMGSTLAELNRTQTAGAPCHYIYQNFDSYSFRTTLGDVAASQLPQQSGSGNETPIKFTSDICAAIYDTYDQFVAPMGARSLVNFHTDLKLSDDLWIAFKCSNNRLLIIFMPNTSSATTLADFKTYCNNIMQTNFEHVHLD